MNNTTKIILALVVGIVLGAGGVMAFAGKPESEVSTSKHMMHGSMGMKSEMDGMMQSLEGKKGDAFDKAFLSEMIVHHQGAVAMAEAALKYAQHQEVKDLAQAILAAQNAEIKQMQEWQKSWYGNE